MKAFTQLTLREQVLLCAGGAILILVGLWLYVWQPLIAERAAQSERIARYLAMIEIAETAAEDPVPVASRPANSTPLAPRITQSAAAAEITLARLDPEGSRLRVGISRVEFGRITEWIASLEASQNVRLLSVEMSRLTEPGLVSLSLTIEDAP